MIFRRFDNGNRQLPVAFEEAGGSRNARTAAAHDNDIIDFGRGWHFVLSFCRHFPKFAGTRAGAAISKNGGWHIGKSHFHLGRIIACNRA